jgi:hypothetical protein
LKTWQKALIPTAITIAIGAIYLYSVYQHRKNPGVIAEQAQSEKVNADDLAVVRMKFMQHYEDTLSLVGTSVWMKNGYTMPYYPFAGGCVEFHRVGLIPPDQRLDIKKIVKASPPAHEDDSISHGARQVFAVFSMAGDANGETKGDTRLYATPIGVMEGSNEQYFCDLLFFYDDPHTIYDWPKDVWASVDAHQAKPGMNELQARTALGQKVEADGGSEGNRTVIYDANGKKWTVTFANDRATAVRSQ